jgi:hypothetical protein
MLATLESQMIKEITISTESSNKKRLSKKAKAYSDSDEDSNPVPVRF